MLWHIGDVIRKTREAKRWTRNELARRARVRPNTIGDLERDGERYEQATLEKVVKALGTSEAKLFPLIPSVTPPVTPAEDDPEQLVIERFRALPEGLKAIVRTTVLNLSATVSASGTPSGNERDNARRVASNPQHP